MFYDTTQAIQIAHKPFDIISNSKGDVGIISEVYINKCQPNILHQINYSVIWLTGNEDKVAWYEHTEVIKHCNLMVKIAKEMYNPFSSNPESINDLFKAGIE